MHFPLLLLPVAVSQLFNELWVGLAPLRVRKGQSSRELQPLLRDALAVRGIVLLLPDCHRYVDRRSFGHHSCLVSPTNMERLFWGDLKYSRRCDICKVLYGPKVFPLKCRKM